MNSRTSQLPAARYYQVGAVAISVQSAPTEARDDFDRLYARYRRPAPGPDSIAVTARRVPRGWLRPALFAVEGDGRRLFDDCGANEVLAHLEWAVNWRVAARYAGFLQFHAAALAYNGRTTLLVGPSGSGKSTLTAALLTRGWTYLTDECALVDPQTLAVTPYPKALCIKSGSFTAVRELGLPLWRRRHHAKAFKGPIGYVDPTAVGAHIAANPYPVGHIVLLHYDPRAEIDLQPLPRAAAVLALLRNTFNPQAHEPNLVAHLARLARNASCHRLDAADAAATADHLTQELDAAPGARRTAATASDQ
jgi:HprK-related kinase A